MTEYISNILGWYNVSDVNDISKQSLKKINDYFKNTYDFKFINHDVFINALSRTILATHDINDIVFEIARNVYHNKELYINKEYVKFY